MVIRTGEGIVKSKFVDRRKELSQLKEHVKELLNGNGRLVLIEGEAGVGHGGHPGRVSAMVRN